MVGPAYVQAVSGRCVAALLDLRRVRPREGTLPPVRGVPAAAGGLLSRLHPAPGGDPEPRAGGSPAVYGEQHVPREGRRRAGRGHRHQELRMAQPARATAVGQTRTERV